MLINFMLIKKKTCRVNIDTSKDGYISLYLRRIPIENCLSKKDASVLRRSNCSVSILRLGTHEDISFLAALVREFSFASYILYNFFPYFNYIIRESTVIMHSSDSPYLKGGLDFPKIY